MYGVAGEKNCREKLSVKQLSVLDQEGKERSKDNFLGNPDLPKEGGTQLAKPDF